MATRLAALDAALEAGGDQLEPDSVAVARAAIHRTQRRLEHGTDFTVVALVGATGSGKSSLFNALARMDIAEVGARRPLTAEPMACVWWDDGATELLDWLEVPPRRRIRRESVLDADRQAPLHGLVLLDLPDHDSTEVSHRVQVDRLVHLVDRLVWVVDPQKYADEALHSGYLQRMTRHDGVMTVVLNQIDRLGPQEADTCRHDLRRLLDGDGLHRVPTLAVSATRGDGVDELRELIAEAVQNRTALADRAAADLQGAADDLAGGLAPAEPGSGALPGADRLLHELANAAGVPAVLDAVASEYRRRGWVRVGWPLLRLLHRIWPQALGRPTTRVPKDDLKVIATSLIPTPAPVQRARVELAVDEFAAGICDPLPPRWRDAVKNAVSKARDGKADDGGDSAGDLAIRDAGDDELGDAIDRAIAAVDLDLAPPAWWRVAGVAQQVLGGVALAGALWVIAIGGSQLTGNAMGSPNVLGIPLPLLLLLAGLLLGAALAAASAWALVTGARRRHEIAGLNLRAAVQEVASDRVLRPVEAVLTRHRAARRALASIDGAMGLDDDALFAEAPSTAAESEPDRPTGPPPARTAADDEDGDDTIRVIDVSEPAPATEPAT